MKVGTVEQIEGMSDLDRVRVEGGWIYRQYTGVSNGNGDVIWTPTSIAFAPDARIQISPSDTAFQPFNLRDLRIGKAA